MRRCTVGWVGASVALLLAANSAVAQKREVSIPYLRAALGALADRERVSFSGEYVAAPGLEEATGSYMRGKGYSRFAVRDPDSGQTFDRLYCSQDSKVFNDLLAAGPGRRFDFDGYKGSGEAREGAIFVTSIAPLATPPEATERPVIVEQSRTYRVTIVDHASSNRTVMVGVELGKPYDLLGSTLTIEAETP